MLEEWMNNNKLLINPEKTHMMVNGKQEGTTTKKAGDYDGWILHDKTNRIWEVTRRVCASVTEVELAPDRQQVMFNSSAYK